MNKKNRRRLSIMSALVFILYISLLIYFVFFSDHYGRVTGFADYRYNLVPFAEIQRYLTYRELFTWENLITNIAGNILVFAPMGVLIPFIRNEKTSFFMILISTFSLSLFIETVQLFSKVGVFDVDDLIMNTVGGILGYIIYRIAWYHYHKKESYRKKKKDTKQKKTRVKQKKQKYSSNKKEQVKAKQYNKNYNSQKKNMKRKG